MKLSLSHSAVLAVLLAGGEAYAACTYPTEPTDIPDGNTATLEQMVAAQKSVKEFDAAIGAYTACLKLEHEAALAKSPDLSEGKKKELDRMLQQKHDAAIAADEALAARFNEQVRAYKAKSAPAK
jgi:hypothetical protein